MTRSKAALALYIAAAVLAVYSVYKIAWEALYSDHWGHVLEALDRELPGLGFAAFVFGMGVLVQNLSDIRSLLLNRGETDA